MQSACTGSSCSSTRNVSISFAGEGGFTFYDFCRDVLFMISCLLVVLIIGSEISNALYCQLGCNPLIRKTTLESIFELFCKNPKKYWSPTVYKYSQINSQFCLPCLLLLQ